MLKREAAHLYPGYFALVMATGILSVAALLYEYHFIAKSLFFINSIFYLLFWVLTVIKLVYYFPKMRSEICHHKTGPAYFTIVAGTSVYGVQWYMIFDMSQIAVGLWFLAIMLWLLIMYTFFTAVIVSEDKPSLSEGINGAWLIVVVATQSISILGTFIAPHFPIAQKEYVLFFTLSMYLLGCMLYLIIMTFIFYRLLFVKMQTNALAPPYWINMGAVAITTLAGANLILHADQWHLIEELIVFVKGFTLFYWVMGTWWIPLLVILMVWRYVYHREHAAYDPQFWAMVFPIAMYTVGTFKLAEALEVSFLFILPKYFFYIAVIIWLVVFKGFLGEMYKRMKKGHLVS